MGDNQIVDDKYHTKYRRYSTNTLLESLKKFDKDSEMYLIIMMILVKRLSGPNTYCREAIIQLEKERLDRLKHNKLYFGTKDEAYFTEEEAISGYKAPTYDELSEDEKAIYLDDQCE